MTQTDPSPAIRPAALWAAFAVACWALLLLGLPGLSHGPGSLGSGSLGTGSFGADSHSTLPAWDTSSPSHVLRLPTPTIVARQNPGGGVLLPRGGPAPLLVGEPTLPARAFRPGRRTFVTAWNLPRRFEPTAWPRGPPAHS